MTSKELSKADAAAAKAERKKNFKGYTMEELRYQKALAVLRKELCRSSVAESVHSLKNPLGSKALPLVTQTATKLPVASTAVTVGKTIIKTLVGRLKPLDYIMLGISLIGPTRKTIRLIKGKKKPKS